MSDDSNDYVSKTLERLEKSVDKVDEKCDHIDKSVATMSTRFESHLEQDEKMYEEFRKMNEILKENTDSLKEHVKRTNTLQEAVIAFNARLEPIEQDRLKKQAVNEFLMSRAAKWGKWLGVAGTLVGIAAGLAKIFWGIG